MDFLIPALTAALGIVVAIVSFLLSTQRLKGIRAQLAKYESRNRDLETLIGKANDALMVIDTVNGQVLEANPSAGQMLDTPMDRLLRRTIFDLHPAKLLERSSERIADVWESGGLVYEDLPFVLPDDSLIPVECSAKVVEYQRRPAILIYARDIRERLKLQNEVKAQAAIIEQKNQDLTDSIVYARRIQESILPDMRPLQAAVPEAFVFYQPKDIVSGDFYWMNEVHKDGRRLFVLAAVDCTGHGVPGAFMSIVGNNLLNTIILTDKVTDPAEVLNRMSPLLDNMLNKGERAHKNLDGMDMTLTFIDPENRSISYAGAMRPLLLMRKDEAGFRLEEIKGDRQAIGAQSLTERFPFTRHDIQMNPGEAVFLYSDGVTDQFGGPKHRKFSGRRMEELLLEHAGKPLSTQCSAVTSAVLDWKGDVSQTDDMMLLAVKF